MNHITNETRQEAYYDIQENLNSRQEQVLEILSHSGDCTASELAMIFLDRGLTPFFSRNFVAPRLTELEKMGKVTVIGKRKDNTTGKTVAVYRTVQ